MHKEPVKYLRNSDHAATPPCALLSEEDKQWANLATLHFKNKKKIVLFHDSENGKMWIVLTVPKKRSFSIWCHWLTDKCAQIFGLLLWIITTGPYREAAPALCDFSLPWPYWHINKGTQWKKTVNPTGFMQKKKAPILKRWCWPSQSLNFLTSDGRPSSVKSPAWMNTSPYGIWMASVREWVSEMHTKRV